MDEAARDALADGRRAGARYAVAGPRRAPAGLAGWDLANRPGSSLEFMDHRGYQPGDDLRRIDWAAYARSDRLSVKLYRQEVDPHVDVLLDGSRSMALAETAKARAALGLAAILATAAENAGYAHRLWLAGEAWQPAANGTLSPAAWDGLDFTFAGSPAETLHRRPPALAPRGIRILVSDLLWVGDPPAVLAPLAEGAGTLAVVQVLAEEDLAPAVRGNVRVVDAETGDAREVFVDTDAERRYRRALARHQELWHRAARRSAAVMVTLTAERLVRDWALDPLLRAGVLKVEGA